MNDDGLAGIVLGRGVRHACSEVAAILGVTRQTVQQTEKRALMKIRRALERQGVRSTADLVEGGLQVAVKACRDYLVKTGKFGTFAVNAQTRLEAVAVILADFVRSAPAFDARSVRTWSVRVLVPCEVPLQGSVS